MKLKARKNYQFKYYYKDASRFDEWFYKNLNRNQRKELKSIYSKPRDLKSKNDTWFQACRDAAHTIESQLLDGRTILPSAISQYAGKSVIKKIAYFQMMYNIVWNDGKEFDCFMEDSITGENFIGPYGKLRIRRTVNHFQRIKHSKFYEKIPHWDVLPEHSWIRVKYEKDGDRLAVFPIEIDRRKFTIAPL